MFRKGDPKAWSDEICRLVSAVTCRPLSSFLTQGGLGFLGVSLDEDTPNRDFFSLCIREVLAVWWVFHVLCRRCHRSSMTRVAFFKVWTLMLSLPLQPRTHYTLRRRRHTRCLYVSSIVHVFTYSSDHLSLYPSISLSIHPTIPPFLHPSVPPSLYTFICASSIHPFIHYPSHSYPENGISRGTGTYMDKADKVAKCSSCRSIAPRASQPLNDMPIFWPFPLSHQL